MESEEEESRVCWRGDGGQVTICVRWWLFRRPECGVPPAHEMPPTPRPGLELLHHHPPSTLQLATLPGEGPYTILPPGPSYVLLFNLTGSLVIFKAATQTLLKSSQTFVSSSTKHSPASSDLATLMIPLLPTVPSPLAPCCYQVLKVRRGC